MAKKKELSFSSFIKRFPTEQACAEYLYHAKWPEGFVCPHCGCREHYPIRRHGRYQCKHCRHQTTLTKWFWAIYLVACDKRGISALALSGKIEICYETAWYMLRRIRGPWRCGTSGITWTVSWSSMIPIPMPKSRKKKDGELETSLYLLPFPRTAKAIPHIWKSYREYIQTHHPSQRNYVAKSLVELEVANSQYIKASKCRYSSGHDSTTVYHIFARIPTQNG